MHLRMNKGSDQIIYHNFHSDYFCAIIRSIFLCFESFSSFWACVQLYTKLIFSHSLSIFVSCTTFPAEHLNGYWLAQIVARTKQRTFVICSFIR